MNLSASFQKFRPALMFVAKFVGLYLILNTIYAFYIESYNGGLDPVTYWVSQQTAGLLNLAGEEISIYRSEFSPKAFMVKDNDTVLSVYEGCNGLNVIFIFFAFIIAYKGNIKDTLWFTLLGILVIHLINLARIAMLYYVAVYIPNYMYFSHKYLFTGIIYIVVFVLWYIWASKLNVAQKT